MTDLSLPPAQTDSQSQSPLPQGLTPPTQANGFQRRLGDVIVDLGFASREQVEAAVIRARNEGQPTGRVLVDSGVLDTRQLARALAERNGLDYVDLNIFSIDKVQSVEPYIAIDLGPGQEKRWRYIYTFTGP